MDRGLQTLSVQNFQILGDVTVDLGRLNVLVGPNGSGKSTLLRVVQFLGDAARSGLASAITAHGGIRGIWTRRQRLGEALQGGAARPPRRSAPRAYHERDSIAIAQHIVADGLLRSFEGGRRSTPHPSGSTRHTRSASFEQFRMKVLAISTVDDAEA